MRNPTHGNHNAPIPRANNASGGPMLAANQYWLASTKPATPQPARTAPSPDVAAARTSSSSGTSANQANHHHDGAGKASAGSVPRANAAVHPKARRRSVLGCGTMG
ncbi:hypothetical protein NJB1907f44_00430 [Mycobacterium marinum]|nr:hypothetical protein NJB1808e29_16100 [Mycobacterium marinum]GJO01958.1 hypothetical protein NJB1907f34b_19610 [Mycobacterium marinum]GJO02969.1 hypothetical protein NJB1907E90_08960 [Mycobacterium marinum]GJO20803.1 hypothetical protein NJB1907E11_28830 [Mycobacterium marinum]GJO27584.1 hypothetical protein NJB1907f22_19220 [Mycobacterium marinum]